MKYIDSQNHTETITADGDTYSPWFDVSFANELYAYIDTSESGTPDDESLIITVERYAPYRTSAPIAVLTFTTITFADLTVTEEKHALSPGGLGGGVGGIPSAENKLGMKVRFKYDMTVTTPVATVTVYSTLYAKRN